MIKFETNIDQKGTALLRLDGTPDEICKETSAMIKSIFERLNEKADAMGIIFLGNLVKIIRYIVTDYESKRFSQSQISKEFLDSIGDKKEPKDIRESDFDSEEQFSKWLPGDKEDKDA